jgi:CheY-like chemotaxis protein
MGQRTAPNLPIVLATTSARDLDAQLLAASGVSEVIHHPLSSAELASAFVALPGCSRGPAVEVVEQVPILPETVRIAGCVDDDREDCGPTLGRAQAAVLINALAAQDPLWVTRAALAACRRLPAFRDKQTLQVTGGTSQRCRQ